MTNQATALALVLTILGCSKQPADDAPRPSDPKPPAPVVKPPEVTPDAAVTAAAVKLELPPASVVTPLAASSNRFGLELWAKAPRGNLAMSPASITTALAMTWGGAKGTTAEQMRSVLHLEGDPDAVMAGWGRLAGALQSPGRALELRIANRLFGEQTYAFEQAYLDRTKAAFGAPLEAVDFKLGSEAARAGINAWVEAQTNKRIKDLLPSGSVRADTRLVLVNAIYFLADWEQPFAKTSTREQPFSVSATQSKSVPTMRQQSRFRLASADGVKVLELPYRGGDAAMWIVLPDKVDGLATVEQALDVAKLAKWKAALAMNQVDVAVPTFTIDPKDAADLSKSLQQLGIVDAFSAKDADFTGIAAPPTPEQKLSISAVFHKAFVKVDEQGTEAAAATAVSMPTGAGMPPKAEEFIADHPFLFLIVDQRSGLILFIGRVVDPA